MYCGDFGFCVLRNNTYANTKFFHNKFVHNVISLIIRVKSVSKKGIYGNIFYITVFHKKIIHTYKRKTALCGCFCVKIVYVVHMKNTPISFSVLFVFGRSRDIGYKNKIFAGIFEQPVKLKDVVVKTPTPNLYLLPAGPQPSDPSGVLSSHRMDHLIAEVTKRFDIVLFDSPPVLGVSDASLLVSKADATLVVLQPRKMPLKALLRTRSIIQNVGGQIMGLVMNNVDISADTQYQYYTTYYSYYSSDTSRKEPKTAVPEKGVTLAAAEPAKIAVSPKSASAVEAVDGEDIYYTEEDIYKYKSEYL